MLVEHRWRPAVAEVLAAAVMADLTEGRNEKLD
jgi:hypothetical protein